MPSWSPAKFSQVSCGFDKYDIARSEFDPSPKEMMIFGNTKEKLVLYGKRWNGYVPLQASSQWRSQ
jgi:hypothetical protein